ncbi:MAG TPA: acyl-CoA dehydrogenase family protein [Anaerolineae bacterium]|nr:acyl-CoA dehydrogenase family protein [Anaerolineae bacterium]
MISFEIPESIAQEREQLQATAAGMMREQARYYDEHEHEIPWDYINMMWQAARASGRSYRGRGQDTGEGPRIGQQRMSHMVEMMSWGDAGLYLCTPGSGLGGAAVEATGTPEQKEKFLARFADEKPAWSCMAMTEAHAGSDTAAIRTRAVKDGDEWVINGRKIFVTCGHKALVDSQGFVVVWATIDPAAGRAGMRPFVVEAGTPGMTVTKLEYKMGIRASDTAELVLDNCRVPAENMLGSEEIATQQKGFKGAMATFDATRPLVAASALGIARATLDLVKELLAAEGVTIPYGVPRTQLSAVQRDVLEMEAMIHAAWLLTLKATWLMDERKPNTIEASMCKVKAGDVVTRVTQKGVELLGPLGYSRRLLLEKWMRDAKINDLFEGTGQINRLVVARRILGYRSRELK